MRVTFLSRLAVRTSLVAVALCGMAAPSFAQHRARLSADLAEQLAHGTAPVEVIIDDAPTADRLAVQYNLKITRRLHHGSVVLANSGQLSALQNDGAVQHLSGNIRYKSSAIVDPIDQGIGVDQVWSGVPPLPALSGQGVTVAVIDSGMDPKHHALQGRVLATVDFTGGNGSDGFGHGTHVAAIIAGAPGQLPATSQYRGVAFGASLINLRVLGNDGSGSAADVIEAVDWAIDHRLTYNIRVINLSLGAPVLQPYSDDPVCAAVERAVRAGILVVAAAGNRGQSADGQTQLGTITSPGNSPYALTVGALDTKGTADRSDDEVAAFSSAGPTAFDLLLKPDLVAPGRRITSAEAAGSVLSVNFPGQHVAGSGPDAYIYGSGTSMAAAFVSGAAALLLQERPALQPAALKAVLEMTSSFIPSAGLVRAGAGSLDVLAAASFTSTEEVDPISILAPDVAGARQLSNVPSVGVVAQGVGCLLSHKLFGETQTGCRFGAWHSYRRLSTSHASSDTVIWGDSDTVIWGDSDTVIWGD